MGGLLNACIDHGTAGVSNLTTNSRFGHDKFYQVLKNNFGAPAPVCIGQADAWVADFLQFEGAVSNVSTFKMFFAAWSSLRTATLIGNMGLTLQTPVIQRHALECIVYGLLFKLDPEFHVLWRKRHEDKKSNEKFRRKHWNRAKCLIELSNNSLKGNLFSQYEDLIDFGAHPNVIQIDQMSDYSIFPNESFGRAEYAMILGKDEVQISHFHTVRLYLSFLTALADTWPDQEETKGLKDRWFQVQDSSLSFIKHIEKQNGSFS